MNTITKITELLLELNSEFGKLKAENEMLKAELNQIKNRKDQLDQSDQITPRIQIPKSQHCDLVLRAQTTVPTRIEIDTPQISSQSITQTPDIEIPTFN